MIPLCVARPDVLPPPRHGMRPAEVASGLRARRAASSTWRIDQRRRPERSGSTAAAAGRPQLYKLAARGDPARPAVLALVSTVFGMMMAVAQDLPALEATERVPRGAQLGPVRDGPERQEPARRPDRHREPHPGRSRRHLLEREAGRVAIEDQRFYTHKGVDYQGIARALWEDVRRQRAAQGASTITQQFVKNALVAQTEPLALPEAQGGRARLPARAQVDQGEDPHRVPEHGLLRRGRVRDRVGGARVLRLEPSRLRAAAARPCSSRPRRRCWPGMIASPAAYSPVQNPAVALERRNLVLQRMHEQTLITSSERDARRERQALPPRDQIQTPKQDQPRALLHLVGRGAARRPLRQR